ncbi:unnamed protein product [Arctogadus glacialis]
MFSHPAAGVSSTTSLLSRRPGVSSTTSLLSRRPGVSLNRPRAHVWARCWGLTAGGRGESGRGFCASDRPGYQRGASGVSCHQAHLADALQKAAMLEILPQQ